MNARKSTDPSFHKTIDNHGYIKIFLFPADIYQNNSNKIQDKFSLTETDFMASFCIDDIDGMDFIERRFQDYTFLTHNPSLDYPS